MVSQEINEESGFSSVFSPGTLTETFNHKKMAVYYTWVDIKNEHKHCSTHSFLQDWGQGAFVKNL
jgi:hypothetical protein